MIRKVAAGIYSLLPLGLRVLRKVETIVREELNRAGAQEVLLPFVIPKELWEESGRWAHYGKELLRFKDRHEREFCLGPTHEEVITDLVRNNVRSYRNLPLHLYQIQIKFRDEIRPRFGLMRGREFIMKDGYSFHTSIEDAEKTYWEMHKVYQRIFERCGLQHKVVEADTGKIGGNLSHEFMVLADTGEDVLVSCKKCAYAANQERAEFKPIPKKGDATAEKLKKVSTPEKRTVEEVAQFLKTSPQNLIKTLILKTDKGLVAALVRGDHELNEAKLRRALGVEETEMASAEEIEKVTRGPVGFSGPLGLEGIRVIADQAIQTVTDGVTGANEKDVHWTHVVPERDFSASPYADIRMPTQEDSCPKCGGSFEFTRGIEVGHIFLLGEKYTKPFKAHFLDEKGGEKLIVMGTYGIGIGRTAAAAIEQNHDERGIIWPFPIAPFQVVIVPTHMNDNKVREVSEKIYKELQNKKAEVLFDDRDERPGVKFNDNDLIGIPLRITIGPKGLAKGEVELKERKSGQAMSCSTSDVIQKLQIILNP
jgi:prolyl-tRNA synthetase